MKRYRLDLSGAVQGQRVSPEKKRGLRNRLRRAILAALTASFLVSPLAAPKQAQAIDLDTIGTIIAGGVGGMLGDKDDSDLERSAKVMAVIGGYEIVKKVFSQPLPQDAAQTPPTVAPGSHQVPQTAAPAPEERGITQCRKVLERVYENGRIVGERVREICESSKTVNSYNVPLKYAGLFKGQSQEQDPVEPGPGPGKIRPKKRQGFNPSY